MWQDDIETIQFAVSWGEAGAYCNELDLNEYKFGKINYIRMIKE